MASDSIGSFIDLFNLVIAASPRYLPPEDWRRHQQLLKAFRQFETWDFSSRESRKIQAIALPLLRLPLALHNWVEEVARNAPHPLAATMAMETAQVFWDHARGFRSYHHGDQTNFEIRAMVEGLDDRADREVANPQLKKIISENGLGRLEVVAKLPENVRLVSHDFAIDQGEGVVHFIVERCHLSQGWGNDDNCDILIQGGNWPLDLSDDFEFFGRAIVRLEETASMNRWAWWEQKPYLPKTPRNGDHLLRTYLPIRWITHVVTSDYPERIIQPLPEDWEGEIRWQITNGADSD